MSFSQEMRELSKNLSNPDVCTIESLKHWIRREAGNNSNNLKVATLSEAELEFLNAEGFAVVSYDDYHSIVW